MQGGDKKYSAIAQSLRNVHYCDKKSDQVAK
jgi:hypothetical protein